MRTIKIPAVLGDASLANEVTAEVTDNRER